MLLAPAAQGEDVAGDFAGLAGAMPNEIREGLPDGFFSGDETLLGAAVEEASGFGALIARICEYATLGLPSALSLFASLLGLLVLCAVMRVMREGSPNDGVRQAMSLASAGVTAGVLLSVQSTLLDTVRGFFESLSVLVGGLCPMVATLYAMGGNVRGAVVGYGGMMTFLAILETVVSGALFPVVGTLTALACAAALAPAMRLGGILNLIKKCYTFFLGALMLVLTFTLSVQTALSSAADNMAMRGAKMLAGSAIPVVGSSIGGTLGAVAAGVGFLKSAVGLGGILLVVFLLVPPLVSVLLHRLAFIAAGVVADVLGCENESRLIGHFVLVYGYVLAAMCVAAVSLVLLLTLFVRCRVAVGG